MNRAMVVLAIAIAMVGMGAVASAPAAAFDGGDVVPLDGLWCGMTEDGGSVRLTVAENGRFVRDIEIRTLAGSIAQSEGFGRDDTQIKSGEFLWRGVRVDQTTRQPVGGTPGGPGRCVRVPCRPISAGPGGGSTGSTTTSVNVSVRGSFETPDYVDGTYTGLTTVSGTHPSTTRMGGKYAAWPAALAACP